MNGLRVIEGQGGLVATGLGKRFKKRPVVRNVSLSVKRGEAVDVHLLNLAKMDKVEQWLEKEKPAAVDEVLRRLERAIVKSFTKTGKNSWAVAEWA